MLAVDLVVVTVDLIMFSLQLSQCSAVNRDEGVSGAALVGPLRGTTNGRKEARGSIRAQDLHHPSGHQNHCQLHL